MTRITLYDPGMASKSLEFVSEDSALASFTKGAYNLYTDALITTGNKVTHIASRDVGERAWTIKKRVAK